MIVLICGANGFIGRRLCLAFERAGHEVRRGVRTSRPGQGEVGIDFVRDTEPERWLARLQGIDVVVNAVGTMQPELLQRVHIEAATALFDACVKAAVGRVVQLSALGSPASARFLATKHAADAHLMSLPLEWSVLRPSLVVGRDGSSSRWFRALASLPLTPLPGRGTQPVQPVSLDDLCEAVLRAGEGAAARMVIDVVGPAPMTYRDMLQAYRSGMNLGPLRALPIPLRLLRGALVLARFGAAPLMSAQSLRMLQAGSQADPAPITHLLGRAPQVFLRALDGAAAGAVRAEALWMWGEPLLRLALAVVWLVTAWVSLFAYPILESLRMLWRVGAPIWSAPVLLVGAALLDAVLGILTLLRPSRALWLTQLALIFAYSTIIAWRLPEMLIHPFGPLLKNVPIVAILLLLLAATPRRGPKPSGQPSAARSPE